MALGKLGSYITLVSGPFHPFGGAIDIVVVQQPDGTFKSSPWYVRFGKFQGVLKSREKIVSISVNGEEAGFCMYLDHKGEAFFLRDVDSDMEGEGKGGGVDFAIFPVSSGDERENKVEKNEKTQLHEVQKLDMQGDESCEANVDRDNEVAKKSEKDENGQLNTGQIVGKDGMEGSENTEVSDGQVVKNTGSRRASILQLMFGRRSSKNKNTAGVERINSLERAEIAADLMEMKWSTNLSMCDRTRLESNSETLKAQHENSVTCESVNVNVSAEEVKVQASDAGRRSLDLQDSPLAEGEEISVPAVEMDSGNVRCQEETFVKTDETVQLSEAGRKGPDLQDSMLAQEQEIGVSLVELDSGNIRNQEESLVKGDETLDIRMVEEGIKVQPAPAGSAHLDWHESEKVSFTVAELDSSNCEGQDENLAKICESADLSLVEEVVELQLTDPCSAGLDLHQSAIAEKEETNLNVVESDSCTSEFQYNNLVEITESVNARATSWGVELPSSESVNAGPYFHDSIDTVCDGTDAVSVDAPSLCDATMQELYVREVNADASSFSGEDHNFVGASLKEVVNDVPQRFIVEEEISGVNNAEGNVHVFSDCIDTISVNIEKEKKEDAVENGAREINQVVAVDSLESYKPEHCNGPGKKHVSQGSVSEANSRFVTVNSYYTDTLESCSSTISVGTPSEDPLNKVLEGSSGDVLPEKMDLALYERQQNENILVQNMEMTDCPDKSSNFELSSHNAVFDKCGDNIYQCLLSDGSSETKKSVSLLTNELESTSLLSPPNLDGLKDEKPIYGFSVPENKEELQFDFSDEEREADYKNKIEIMASVSANENETLENDIENTDASNSESCSETNPISIPGASDNRIESMARSLPNIQFDKIEQTERLSCSLEMHVVQKEKDSLSIPKEDSQSSSSPNQIKSETGAVHHGTLDVPDGKSSAVNPFIELSLCKHMLSEGMGEEAARQAFDSQKLTMEKFRELGPPNLIKNDKLAVRIGSHYFPYEFAAPVVLGMASFGEAAKELLDLKGMIKVDQVDPTKSIVRAGGSWRLWPFGFRRSKTISTLNVEEEVLDSNLEESEGPAGMTGRKKVRSLVPTSEEIASLHLKEGRNIITFTFSTAMLGKQQVDARIFLWKWNTRIVISDVDGTITRSDVLGQFMPLVGVDWSQTGVAHLFSAIKDNGYQLLFLSARAISQAHLTRQFLCSLKQDGKALPEGPVVISPDGLFPSLYREVIRRAPHEFKISCLEAIKALFPADCNPFYAGFGNRDTDEISYLKVGIPMGKIFIINPKGEVAVHRRVDTKSYSSLHELVNGMFPPYLSLEQESYNDINFWRLPLPAIEL